jgi:hypothetical protein
MQLGVIQGAGKLVGLARDGEDQLIQLQSGLESTAVSGEDGVPWTESTRSTEKMAIIVVIRVGHDCAVLFGLHRWRPR